MTYVSEIRKGKRGNPLMRQWWSDVDDDELFLSVLNLGEIREVSSPYAPGTHNKLTPWNSG